MRFIPILLLLATPAFAQDDVTYDDKAVNACLTAAADDGARHACIGQASTTCMDAPGGYSTVGMTSCVNHERDDWDRLLNDNYGKLVSKAKENDAANGAQPTLPMLQKMQRDWITFRDSSCKFAASQFQGGTAAGPAAEVCVMTLTGEQALRLGSMIGETR
ncbi:lysozyme inhibitor LprI family protein [Paracoccus laeviglucosivorans]|uniref:Uncharacterized conserved protein YecT, DUF1311 family n=1 Tax=Paracoccus laeviglucosivorans TaxID=1197861 RepID=A0A521CC60_9RHOB|nr:lysozyme inhibitor LprI family protein [Paracoccus laeviglucosivorans]SMO57013.1 Uncharacterized conserved protein YecT, DUF1311 family [Paracoccus laeviglucosivorans]